MRLNLILRSLTGIVCLAFVSSAGAATDFLHGRVSVQSIYPTQATVMQQMTNEEQSLVAGQLSDGDFEPAQTGDDITDTDWGSVALLTYWWYTNGQNNLQVATAAANGLKFALANRDWTQDPQPIDGEKDSTYLLVLNSGQHYAKYHLNDTSLDANYAETAFTLIYKAMILQYGQGIFTQTQLSVIKAQAYSHWTWLTTVSVYNPELAANQVMAAILGGYMLGVVANDPNLMSQALGYYTSGLPGTNNTRGYRNTDRYTTPQSYSFFTEHFELNSNGTVKNEGFDTHYSGFQLTLMVVLNALMKGGTTSQVYQDALAEAQYIDDRLSQAGTMHGGSRWNEISGSTTDIVVALGYGYFSNILNNDLGRVLQDGGSASNTAGSVQVYGHRAQGILFLHEYFPGWSTNQLTVNDLAGFRRGNASVFFDENDQPQEIGVNGTSFTECLLNNTKTQGFFYVSSSGQALAPSVMAVPATSSTPNFTLRTVTGTVSNSDANVSLKTYYITNGTSLYQISLAYFKATATLPSVNFVLGLPNESSTKRIVDVYDAASGQQIADLSTNNNTISSKAMQMGGARLDAWPVAYVDNTVSNSNALQTWMTPSSYSYTLDGLSALSPRIYWYPTGSEETATSTDAIRINVHSTFSPATPIARQKQHDPWRSPIPSDGIMLCALLLLVRRRRSTARVLLPVVTIIIAGSLSACGGGIVFTEHAAVTPPAIGNFAAAPSSITAGESTALSWSATGAASYTLSGVAGNVTSPVTVSPSATTTYTLTATNSGGSTTASTNVTVYPDGTYLAGDMVAGVARFAPAGTTDAMIVTPTYQPGSTYKISSLTVQDSTMQFTVSWNGGAAFTDVASGQTIHP